MGARERVGRERGCEVSTQPAATNRPSAPRVLGPPRVLLAPLPQPRRPPSARRPARPTAAVSPDQPPPLVLIHCFLNQWTRTRFLTLFPSHSLAPARRTPGPAIPAKASTPAPRARARPRFACARVDVGWLGCSSAGGRVRARVLRAGHLQLREQVLDRRHVERRAGVAVLRARACHAAKRWRIGPGPSNSLPFSFACNDFFVSLYSSSLASLACHVTDSGPYVFK